MLVDKRNPVFPYDIYKVCYCTSNVTMNRKQKVTMTIIHMGLILPEKRLNDDDNDNKCNDIYSHWYMVQFVDN